MKDKLLPVGIILTVLIALSVGLSAAQGPAPSGGGQPQVVVGSAFTYQGELQKDGSPINATCEMTFTLYDDATAGTMVGNPINASVAVNNGLFTVALDWAYLFTGNARWLEVVVLCPGDAGASTLTPRQEMTATPYALSLRPGASIQGARDTGPILSLYNSATTGSYSYGLYGRSDSSSTGAAGVFGRSGATSGYTHGVHGEATSPIGTGVYGENTATSGNAFGVRGVSNSPTGRGVFGEADDNSGENYGVYGVTLSTAGYGVYGWARATTGSNYGVWGQADGTNGVGVRGYATATSGTTYGVAGRIESPDGQAIRGLAAATTGDAYGVYGESGGTAGIGVRGWGTNATGVNYGVHGQTESSQGRGVCGYATADSGPAWGVYGRSNSTDGRGVYGLAAATGGTTYGVYGETYAASGAGVYGYAGSATTSTRAGVKGVSNADQGRGVYGLANGTTALADGVLGESTSGLANGVAGIAWATTGTGCGVFGQTHSPSGYAGYFSGNTHVNGTLTAVVKAFKIDHPSDPAEKYLYHYSVESSEVLNQYSGNITLGTDGSAWVDLPSWFGAINQDIRYQLTPIGAPAPGLYIARKVADNRFQIAGGAPGLEVSWLITAVRSDPYLQRYGAPVEVEKPAEERGTYLFPELYGQPEELGRDYTLTQGRSAPVENQAPAAATDPPLVDEVGPYPATFEERP